MKVSRKNCGHTEVIQNHNSYVTVESLLLSLGGFIIDVLYIGVCGEGGLQVHSLLLQRRALLEKNKTKKSSFFSWSLRMNEIPWRHTRSN